MKSAKILVSAVLIPALMVASGGGASDSIQKLLRKPRYGQMQINLLEGIHIDGAVTRVTTEFLTLREPTTCENVELSKIASFKRLPPLGDGGGAIFEIGLLVLASPFWGPFYIASTLSDGINGLDALHRNWESIPPSAEGKVNRIEFYEPSLAREELSVRRGHYEVTGDQLQLSYEGSGISETIPFRFDCEALVLGPPTAEWRLDSADPGSNQAQPPIVGRWHDGENSGYAVQPRLQWEFGPSGTFEKRTIEARRFGTFKRGKKHSVRVTWSLPSGAVEEEWYVRTAKHRLFVTASGITTEYERAPNTHVSVFWDL
jgi:hypothetical protein